MISEAPLKYCAHCKKKLRPDVDEYEEFRFSYETEDEENVTNISIVYFCNDCHLQGFGLVEDAESDEY